MGIIKPSHWPSVMRKSFRNRTSRGTRLKRRLLPPLKRIAHASHAQISFRLAGSNRCWCSDANAWLHISHVSKLVRLRANWRRAANAESGMVFEEDTVVSTPLNFRTANCSLGERDARSQPD